MYGSVAAVATRTAATIRAGVSAGSPAASIVTTHRTTGHAAALYRPRRLENTPPDCIGIDAQKGSLDESRIRQFGKDAFRIVDETVKELRVFLRPLLNDLQCGLKRLTIHRGPPPRQSRIANVLETCARNQWSTGRPRAAGLGEHRLGAGRLSPLARSGCHQKPARMSAAEGKADLPRTVADGPLMTQSRHSAWA